jgi:hypothetical protein
VGPQCFLGACSGAQPPVLLRCRLDRRSCAPGEPGDTRCAPHRRPSHSPSDRADNQGRPGASGASAALNARRVEPGWRERLHSPAGAGRCPHLTTSLAARHSPAGPFAPNTLLTLAEIADLLSRDPKTIKIWRADGNWPNAVQDENGRKTWRVPVTDLVTADDLASDQVAHVESELAARREHRETKALREQTIRLQEQLAAAQALADERAATITFLKGLLRKGGAA